MGVLDQVAMIQEDYRDLLRAKVGAGGPTLHEESRHGASDRYGEDTIVNVCVALETRIPTEHTFEDVLHEAVALLDYLDTLGMEVRFKNEVGKTSRTIGEASETHNSSRRRSTRITSLSEE